jgi:ubiquinone/menaquinone biosynthesis C-methylase UbiE
MSKREHWENVYRSRGAGDVSWYRPHLERSIDLILRTGAGPDARIIDVGGGASTLVDDLLARGFRHVTVADLSAAALEVAKTRLGARAAEVTWLCGDVTTMDLTTDTFDVWHDRAVFHFLTSDADRRAYLHRVCRAVRKGGHLVMATFGPHGPEKCSGLEVVRYSAGELHGAFGPAFRLVAHEEERHVTPWGAEQEFVYCLCVREAAC